MPGRDAVSLRGIKKNDTVTILTGNSSGKTGKVLEVFPEKQRAYVEGCQLQKKTLRKTQSNPQGGIVDKEGPIHISNLLLFCPHCKKGVRTSVVRDGTKGIRKCRKCSHSFDS